MYVNFLKEDEEISSVAPRNKYFESPKILEGCYEKVCSFSFFKDSVSPCLGRLAMFEN